MLEENLRSVSYLNLAVILSSIILAVSGQLLLKLGLLRVGKETGHLLAEYARALTQPLVWLGLVCFGVSMLIWLYVLARMEMSVAFPFLGLNYALIMIGSRVLLGEAITGPKIVGTACIVLGILFIARG
jgi:drug/metabolite transporter (DMT)-like permease